MRHRGVKMPNSHEIDSILARLKVEFIESTRDQLDEIETRIDQLDDGLDISADTLFGVQRRIHNIKGQGATFGFPLVGRMAHLFEDYLENVGGVKRDNIHDLRIFIDTMVEALESGEAYGPTQAEDLLRTLPTGRQSYEISSQHVYDVDVLLVMPAGLQRKMIAGELLSCGFRVNRAYDSVEALSHALDLVPDIVFASYDLNGFNGLELARVFSAIKRLHDIHFVLFTSYKADDAHVANLPDNVSIVEKRQDYAKSLSDLLHGWGMFGQLAS